MACIETMSLRQKQQRTGSIFLEGKKKKRKTAQGSLNGVLIALINQSTPIARGVESWNGLPLNRIEDLRSVSGVFAPPVFKSSQRQSASTAVSNGIIGETVLPDQLGEIPCHLKENGNFPCVSIGIGGGALSNAPNRKSYPSITTTASLTRPQIPLIIPQNACWRHCLFLDRHLSTRGP